MGEIFLAHIPFLPPSFSSSSHCPRTNFYFHMPQRVPSSRGFAEWWGLEEIRHVSSSYMPGHTCWWREECPWVVDRACSAQAGACKQLYRRGEVPERCANGHVEVLSKRQAGVGAGTGASREFAPSRLRVRRR